MTKMQNAVDRALLGLHLSEDDAQRALDWVVVQVDVARQAGMRHIDLPASFNIDVVRSAVQAGMVGYFWQSGYVVRAYVTRGDQPVPDVVVAAVGNANAGPERAA